MNDIKYLGVQGLEELITLTKNSLARKGETKTDGTLKTSDEHHVYGSSDTVQPPAVAINYIIKY